ncbi:MAG TPA: ribonuclease D [Longimicrobiales bacterium]
MEYVTTERELGGVAERLSGARFLAVDTEAAGYHRYFDRVCLVQLSTPSATFVIDTLAVPRLDPLRPVFERPSTEVVFHDADYDLRLLSRDFGIRVRGLFDTKVAAQFLGEPAIGLASLVERHLGIRLEKAYQRADWAQRPLPAEMLEYAAGDTRHLLPLRDILRRALETLGRLEWAEEEFRIQEDVRWTAPAEDPGAYLRLKGTRDLRPRELAILRELYAWREGVARARDVAPFRVLSNEAMIEIARRAPDTPGALAAVPGTPRSLASRHGGEILAAIERARALPEAALPKRPRGSGRPPPDPVFDATLERLRAVRDEVATALGLDRGFLMPRAQLEELARLRPGTIEELAAVPGLRRWQVAALGERLLAAMPG